MCNLQEGSGLLRRSWLRCRVDVAVCAFAGFEREVDARAEVSAAVRNLLEVALQGLLEVAQPFCSVSLEEAFHFLNSALLHRIGQGLSPAVRRHEVVVLDNFFFMAAVAFGIAEGIAAPTHRAGLANTLPSRNLETSVGASCGYVAYRQIGRASGHE